MHSGKPAVFILGILIFGVNLLAAQQVQVVMVRNLPADPEPQTDQFTLFSFAEGRAIPLKNFDTDQWDLGFKGTTIIVNGGKERRGKGGVFLTSGVFDAIDALPDAIEWRQDEPDGKTAIAAGSGNGWYEYLFTTHEIKPIQNQLIFVKTAQGKFAKVEILSYYREVEGETDSPGRYYTFRYAYQPDGSVDFN